MTKKDLLERFVPILLVVSVALAFIVGMLWQKVSYLEKGGVQVAGTQAQGQTAQQAAQPAVAPNPNDKLSEEQAKKVPLIDDSDHLRGSKDAKVVLIEYSDLQCPFCQRFHPTVKQALDEYQGKVSWIYRHFPLDAIHPNARPAAIASECVSKLGGQDSFWAFVDKIFENQDTSLADLSSTASSVGVDKAGFDSCLNAKETEGVVDSQYQGGVTAGVNGTPSTFLVNDKGEVWNVSGAVDYATLKAAIDKALGS